VHRLRDQVQARSLELPTPMRDARTLRTLALLDLESHPPGAAIDRVVVAVDPTPGRIVQYSLLTRPLPAPEQISTLMARLGALMGEGRCGSPAPVDSWRPGAFTMRPFAPTDEGPAVEVSSALPSVPVTALRRFRHPVPARVAAERGAPVRVTTDRRGLLGGRVERAAGPWRTSGGWWESEWPGGARMQTPEGRGAHGGAGTAAVGVDATAAASVTPAPLLPPSQPWDRDEWDVTLSDGATYRLFRQRDADAWFIDGIVD
jgi:protein ImuB